MPDPPVPDGPVPDSPVPGGPVPDSSVPDGPVDTSRRRPLLVAVTACPTGIAHTYMAAAMLEDAAERAGVEIHVETQGAAGVTPLPPQTIADASAVIFAVDVGVRDRGRFADMPLVSSGVKRPMDDADSMIAEALACADDPNAPCVESASASGPAPSSASGRTESRAIRIRRVLMTGVSYMIPFVAAGGLLIALGFLLAGYQIALRSTFGGVDVSTAAHIATSSTLWHLPDPSAYDMSASNTALPHPALLTYLGALLFALGQASFTFLVPALAGYISFAIADRPGIAPGFVMGYIANSVLNAGFLGGIVGGVLAGLVAHWIAQRKVPSWARGLMPVMLIPLGPRWWRASSWSPSSASRSPR